MKKTSLIIIAFLFATVAMSQEMVVKAGYSPSIEKIELSKENDTLELPFLDDFSTTFPNIDNSIWIDNNVNISRTMAYRPPSIGTVTFDAIDNEQNYYSTSYSSAHRADILTSKPIDLFFPGYDSLYISFYYQAQGIVDFPQTQDSLVLQFYDVENEIWETVWATEGTDTYTEEPDFNQVMIHITEEKYLKKGFQFRFYNKASLTASNIPSLVGNCDHWHLDYVYLNKSRDANDVILKELAFQHPLVLKIDNYQTIPYGHYKHYINIGSSFNINYEVKFRNNDNEKRDIDSMNIIFKELNGYVEDYKHKLGSSSFPQSSNYTRDAENIEIQFPIIDEDKLNYELKTYLVTDGDDATFNNIVYQNKTFGGNYSYDDCTSEAGYDLIGGGSIHAFVANKFYTYKEDTLTAIQMLFNSTFKDAQPQYFYLMVWDNDPETGLPGRLIHEQQGAYIDFLKANQFQTYEMDSSFAVVDTFFVGWKKTDEQFMNVGLDLNTTGENHKFYNLNGNWVSSAYEGELLVQPVFGKANHIGIDEIKNKISFNIFPNPVSNVLNFNIENQNFGEDFEIIIYNIYGQKLYQNNHNSSGDIDVGNFDSGIYLINIISSDREIITKKFIKQ